MKTQSTIRNLRQQTGFTIVELMIAVTISLMLVLFIGSLYVGSKSSYRLNDDNARLLEDGNYAMNLIGRNLMQSGFGNVVTGTTTDFVDAAGNPAQGLMGCDNGFAAPADTSVTPTCATSGKPGFQVRYRVADTYNANTATGADCNGQSVDLTTASAGIATNRFYLTSNTLYCNGSGNTTSQPILSNVEDMVVTYGVDTTGTYTPDRYLTNAASINALPRSAINKKNWNQVVSVLVCLLITSVNRVAPQGQTYTDCSGTSQTATDGKLRRSLTSVFALRNNAIPSLL